MLRALFYTLTYRTEHTDPTPADGLEVIPGRWGARTVHNPMLPAYLDARRERLVLHGLDDIDRRLTDPATLALLNEAADRIAARRAPAAVAA
jgi:hypothetical protein